MLSEISKAAVDSLSKEELQHEINLAARSRFQGEKFAYVKTRLSALLAAEQAHDKAEQSTDRKKELFLKSISTWVAIGTSVLGLVFGGGWFQEYQKSKRAQTEATQRLVAEYLQPIDSLLKQNAEIYEELRSPRYVEPPMGILESYLIKIRRDGVSKHALMKQRIDTLVSSNQTILTFLAKYEPYALTNMFKSEATKFRSHAVLYSDRWKSLLEVYASNGNFPADALPFPTEFPAAVAGELEARRI